MFALELPQIENHPKLSCSYGILFQGTQEGVRNSGDKKAISVQAIEVLLYIIGGPKEDTVKPILSKHLWDNQNMLA